MSVIFTAKGCIIYETQDDLASTVTRLRETNQMNDSNEWVNGSNTVLCPGSKQVSPEWNGLEIPFGTSYRNLSTGSLLEGASWATVVTLAGPSDETVVRNADHDIVHRINMEDWFRENVVDESPHLGWEHEFIDEIWDPIDIEPPVEIKEQMRIKNAERRARTIHQNL